MVKNIYAFGIKETGGGSIRQSPRLVRWLLKLEKSLGKRLPPRAKEEYSPLQQPAFP